MSSRRQAPAASRLLVAAGSRGARELTQIGRRARSSPDRRQLRCPVQRRGDAGVRAVGTERQVTSALLGILAELGQTPMDESTLERARATVGRGCEQRMAEADASCADVDQFQPLGNPEQLGHGPVGVECFEQLHRGMGRRCRHQQGILRPVGRLVEPMFDEFGQRAGQRQWVFRSRRLGAAGQGVNELQREERIAPGRLVDLDHRPTR
jgi:hypothetical protein